MLFYSFCPGLRRAAVAMRFCIIHSWISSHLLDFFNFCSGVFVHDGTVLWCVAVEKSYNISSFAQLVSETV